ncbi:MAG: cysteine desulfurase family protein [Labrys sp. (in: a-proteobacteria)]
MHKRRAYLDHNATTPLRPEARAAVLAALDHVGAAASVHQEGRGARALVEKSRHALANLVGLPSSRVVFTSGASEANNMALSPLWERGSERRPLDWLITSTIEHACVLNGARFAPDRIIRLPVTADGIADIPRWLETIERLHQAGERPLVSLMLANNETGAIQPLALLAEAVRQAGGVFHTDAAQAVGKIAIDAAALGADLLTLSSHKLGGPAGVGALLITDPALHLADRLIRGGGQEQGWRAGTENIAGIAGFAAAASAAAQTLDREGARLAAMRDRLGDTLAALAPTTIFASNVARLPNTLNLAVRGVAAETALMALDLEGVAVSSGSACSSGKVRPSHVLAAMGVDEALARCALRLSLGWSTEEADIEQASLAWNKAIGAIHRRQEERAA